MNNALLKKATIVVGATAILMSISISAFAATNSQNFERNDSSVGYTVKRSEDFYVHQYVDNTYNDNTYVVMNSDYFHWNGSFSLTGIYAAQPFLVNSGGMPIDPYNRFVEVTTVTTDDKARSAKNCVDANKVSVLTRLENQTNESKLKMATIHGDSRTVDTIKNPNQQYKSYCEMDCTLTFN